MPRVASWDLRMEILLLASVCLGYSILIDKSYRKDRPSAYRCSHSCGWLAAVSLAAVGLRHDQSALQNHVLTTMFCN